MGTENSLMANLWHGASLFVAVISKGEKGATLMSNILSIVVE
ncbi:hypothetical protein MTBBW1_1880005 [Desulfamplus magnetovallimortis]|uniref:Uncharacterized protein n=1 Tax=Desulfamplus magnetovallimortis TaxID=1246637 RepID=A0A1W1HB14_9BACT|nr:hypothetical protein MTBBW1_1880005 [Desulfamplus magnetovallimortis]